MSDEERWALVDQAVIFLVELHRRDGSRQWKVERTKLEEMATAYARTQTHGIGTQWIAWARAMGEAELAMQAIYQPNRLPTASAP